jgi:hypothetical protein
MSKYKNRKTTVDGIVFDSKKEAARYQELRLLERAGEIQDLRCQVPFELVPAQRDAKGKLVERPVKYLADFVYQDCATGERVVEDVKGYRTDVYKIKRRLMNHLYGIDIKET